MEIEVDEVRDEELYTGFLDDGDILSDEIEFEDDPDNSDSIPVLAPGRNDHFGLN